jgi:N-acetyl-anhydromuramyl-L-alanine amidase AmpD
MTTTSIQKKASPKTAAFGRPGTIDPDSYARAIIAEGQRDRVGPDQVLDHPVITPRGIIIALATALVESNLRMYASNADPESVNYPHDAIGFDQNSVGLFQQRGPWWGTVADRMDPARSAAMFYHALAGLDYNSNAHPPGWYAQQVQKSAFPDRYDQRFGEATRLYTKLFAPTPGAAPARPDFNEYPKWSPNCQSRSGTKVDLWLIHTEEGGSNADQLASWLDKTASQVSYHYTISEDPNDHGVTVCDVVDTDYASWSVGNSNNRSINFCFAGSRASWTRDQWMGQSRAIDVAAYLAVADCRKYGIPIKVLWPYCQPGGIADHRYCSQYLKDGNNHSDVGDNFPWDVFTAAVNKYAGIAVPSPALPSAPAPAAPSPAPSPAPPDYTYLTGAVADLVKRVAALEQSAVPAPAKAAVRKAPAKRTK